MFTPLAQYTVQAVRQDRLVEAQAAHRRQLAREARRVDEQGARVAPRRTGVTVTAAA